VSTAKLTARNFRRVDFIPRAGHARHHPCRPFGSRAAFVYRRVSTLPFRSLRSRVHFARSANVPIAGYARRCICATWLARADLNSVPLRCSRRNRLSPVSRYRETSFTSRKNARKRSRNQEQREEEREREGGRWWGGGRGERILYSSSRRSHCVGRLS
jgi:hypothetical protein